MLWDKDPKYPAQTLAVVANMAKRFSSFPALLGFNLLDSPVVRDLHIAVMCLLLAITANLLLQRCYTAQHRVVYGAQVGNSTLAAYYLAGYKAVRTECLQCVVTITPPSWQQDGAAWRHFMTGPGYTNVFQDLHRCCRSFLLCNLHANEPMCYLLC